MHVLKYPSTAVNNDWRKWIRLHILLKALETVYRKQLVKIWQNELHLLEILHIN
jgi:hypothetical protein